MLVLLSPAKSLDLEAKLDGVELSQPRFLKKSSQLIKELRSKSQNEISDLMKLSDTLAELNVERYGFWNRRHTKNNSHPALLCFKGAVYLALESSEFTKSDFKFANKHIRILSGLYGVLRPLDLMQPYRLEMGTKLENESGDNLYKFWGNDLASSVNSEESDVVVNLASNEYFKSIGAKNLDAQVITPVFKEQRGSDYKTIGVFAKTARGLMTKYIVKNKIKSVAKLKEFDDAGYSFNEQLSDDAKWVFTRSGY
ncbi:MAG: peroxide stress protein YaaA [Planctomycetota bacterium]|jgi:hypothetical protein|nr:peroxide stress protein YaaA [Planctomycetota bacterium]